MRNIQRLFLMSFAFFLLGSCKKKITKATLTFYSRNNFLDSIVFLKKKDLEIIEEALNSRELVGAKFPRVYFLKVEYSDETTIEYNGNGQFIRNVHIYQIPKGSTQLEYLQLINSKLPDYLKTRP